MGGRNFNFGLVVIFLAVVLCVGFEMQPMGVSANITTINTLALYTFTIVRSFDPSSYPTPWNTTLVPAGSNLTIQFPTGYNTSYGYWSQVNGTNYSLVQDGLNISLLGLFPTDTALDTMTLLIGNVLNPSPAFTTD